MSQPKLLKVEPVESSELHLFYGNGGRLARPCGGGDRPLARRAGGVRRQAAGRPWGPLTYNNAGRPARAGRPFGHKKVTKNLEKRLCFCPAGCAIMAVKK